MSDTVAMENAGGVILAWGARSLRIGGILLWCAALGWAGKGWMADTLPAPFARKARPASFCDQRLSNDLRRISCDARHLTAFVAGTAEKQSASRVRATVLILRRRKGAEHGDVFGYYSAAEFECGAGGGDDLLLTLIQNPEGSLIDDPVLTSQFIDFWFSREMKPERRAIGRILCALKV